jgi:hypothetical protein
MVATVDIMTGKKTISELPAQADHEGALRSPARALIVCNILWSGFTANAMVTLRTYSRVNPLPLRMRSIPSHMLCINGI